MANQSTIKANDKLNDDDLIDDVKTNFKWTTKLETSLLFNMIRLKPSGINKHLNILLLQEKMNHELKRHIPTKSIWKYLESKWNIQAADIIENTNFNTNFKELVLPIEYDQLILEEREKIINEQGEQCLKNKRRLSNDSGKKISKANSAESKDSSNNLPYQSITLSENLLTKTNEDIFTEVSIRRSLRSVEKVENNLSNKKQLLRTNIKLDEVNKSINLKLLNENKKRKSRNVSESSFSSDNSKNPKNYKNNVTDLAVFDRSPRSITPENLQGKSSVTSETINRKSNLRSNDKDQKSKLILRKSYKFSSNVDLSKPEIKNEHLKAEKQCKNKALKKIKSKHTILKNKNKIRGRITSDLLVVQQNPDCQSLGKRSCSNKNS